MDAPVVDDDVAARGGGPVARLLGEQVDPGIELRHRTALGVVSPRHPTHIPGDRSVALKNRARIRRHETRMAHS